MFLFGLLICRNHNDNNDSGDYNDDDNYNDSSDSHCMCHQTIYAKLIAYTVRGVICVDHINNSVIRSSYSTS